MNTQNEFLGWGCCTPVVPVDDTRANYPLNNVMATCISIDAGLILRLRHNMFEFDHFEGRIDEGPWQPILVIGAAPFWYFIWQPQSTPSTFSIRGVTISGVHSPDVVIRINSISHDPSDPEPQE